VIALAVSALIAAYLLIPNALFRFVLGRIVPLRIFQERKTDDLTRAVVTLALIYVVALIAVWDAPACRSHPFNFPDNPSLRVSDYRIVASALYSEAAFREYGTAFWDAFGRTLERQGRFICWYYVFVMIFAALSGWAIRHYGDYRRSRVYLWVADFYLLPHISQWYVLLTPFTFADKRTAVKADVLMTDNTLYRGNVADHFIDKDGNLSGLFLSNPQRFDRRAYLREQDEWGVARSVKNFWRPIPSAKLYLVADKIINLNLNYDPPTATAATVEKYLETLQKTLDAGFQQRISVSVSSPRK
jgi:hypothetical protein